ncbi:MAG: peptide-binding protein [Zetaproteobacteria bacterium]|nr:peptide-binding protein [Zetaproteobacteria bacterium]
MDRQTSWLKQAQKADKSVVLLLITLLITPACSFDDASLPPPRPASTTAALSTTPTIGGTLIDASIGDASTLIPLIASDAASHAITGMLYLSLLKYDKDLNLVGQLADHWTIADNNLSITFHIRPNIHWSDGQAFDAHDCVFTLALMQNEHTQSPYKSDYLKVSRFEAPDDSTFIVHYDEPYSPALASWAQLSILPQHDFEHEDIMNTPRSRQPKATLGPYTLQEWQPQQSIRMKRNPNYFDGTVWIDERLTRIIPDSATQFLELSAGRIDMMTLTPMQYNRLFETEARLTRDYARYRYTAPVYTYLGFNLKRPMFADQRVREAMAYAIDRQELVDGVLLGEGEVIASPYKPGTYWVNQHLKPRSYQPEKAKALLMQAGWHDEDGDGYLEKDGQPLRFTVLTNNGNQQRATCAMIMQQRLKAVGIQMNIRLVEWSAFIENFINKRDFDAVILGWSLSPEPDQYSIWHSSQTGPRQFNFLSYSNKVVDHALESAQKVYDPVLRKQYYDQMQQEIFNDLPLVFLFAPYALPTLHKRVQGIKPAPAGIGHNSEFWHISSPAINTILP